MTHLSREPLPAVGTSTLTFIGRVIAFDPTTLGVSTIYVDGIAHDGSASFSIRLLPGQHEVRSTIGTDVNWITVNNDGTIAYDATLQGVFTGAGTSTLTIAGRIIAFDPTTLGVSTIYVDGIAYDGSTSFSIRLLPGQHEVRSPIGTDINWITVNNDGTIAYDASLEGAFTGAGTSTLTIAGRPVTIDATALGKLRLLC